MSSDIKPDEIAAILKKQLADFESKSENYEIGTVLSVGFGWFWVLCSSQSL